MKNVLIHLHPSKTFDQERAVLVRVQVDNSLDLGWRVEDILLITNFPYEYNGVKAVVIGDEHFCQVMPRSTNTVTIPHLCDLGLVGAETVHWVHDFDAYQLNRFGLELDKELGLTNYGWSTKWCLGSFFFKQEAKDIFQWVKDRVNQEKTEDERALTYLTKTNYQGINARWEVLNITYNFGMRHITYNYENADLPLKVLHFHPWYRERSGLNTHEVFFEGKNGLGFPLVDDRLREIFKHHGI